MNPDQFALSMLPLPLGDSNSDDSFYGANRTMGEETGKEAVACGTL